MGRQILHTREIVLSGSEFQYGAELGDVNVMKTPPVVSYSIDPQIETAMKA